jgi:hypothetical protein
MMSHTATLQWLHEHDCPWDAAHICGDGAESGSIEKLLYLKQQGCEYTEDTMMGATLKDHLAVCQYLMAEQCPCYDDACDAAAGGGHLEVVHFLHESGCPWDVDTICVSAAHSGSVELLQYLKQQGCVLNAAVMRAAAQRGDSPMCHYLRTEQCPWDSSACRAAARSDHVDTLRWLHEQGCPWNIHALRVTAAELGHLPVLVYLMGVEPAASAVQLTEMLNAAGFNRQCAAAQWLRQQGAQWPAVLIYGDSMWSIEACSGLDSRAAPVLI